MKLTSRIHWILVFQALWLVTLILLSGWWGHLLLSQAGRIAELEKLSGITSMDNWGKTSRMLFWETLSFWTLLLAVTVILTWLYWRDHLRNRSLQAFFASVTHEFRTPLTSIRLQTESIAEKADPGRIESRLVKRLLEDTARLESQIERTLELARLEGGGPLLTQSVSLRASIERILREWNSSHLGAVQLRHQLLEEAVLADPSALQMILKNLIENSLKHSGVESIVVDLTAHTEGDWLRLHYADNGGGFSGDPKALGRLFQKGPGSQGAGVGLYLVQSLMKKMGGRLEYQREPKGFHLSLFFRRPRP